MAPFVPHVSVLMALALTFVTVAFLVFFFHHIAQSVRVTHILSKVDKAFQRRLDGMTEAGGDGAVGAHGPLPHPFDDDVAEIRAERGGYLQSVEVDALVGAATRAGAAVRVLPTVGDFVRRGSALAEVHPSGAAAALAEAVHEALALGEDRNLTQDLGFYFDQFLEIALRALSPSTNDPFTARSCIDRAGQGLLLLDRRRLPPHVHRDDGGKVRALVPLQSKGALARHVVGEFRRASAEHPFVRAHLAATLRGLAAELGPGNIRDAVVGELAEIDAAVAGRRAPAPAGA